MNEFPLSWCGCCARTRDKNVVTWSEGTSGKEEQRFCSENVKIGASIFGKQCSFYERKENTHEYCTSPWRLGGRLQLERRHRAPASRRLQRHRTPVSADRAGQ